MVEVADLVAFAAAFIVTFVVAFLATPSAGETRTRGAFAGAIALGGGAFLGAGALFDVAIPTTLDRVLVALAGLTALAALAETTFGVDRPVRVNAIRAALGTAVGFGVLWVKFQAPDWPLNHAFGAAVVAGGCVYVAASLLDGAVDRRPLLGGVHLGAWIILASLFLTGSGNFKYGRIGGALVAAVAGLLTVRFLDRTARTEGILRGAPVVVAGLLGSLLACVFVYNVPQDRPSILWGVVLVLAAAGSRVGDALREKHGDSVADAVGLAVTLVLGGAAAGVAASLNAGPAY